MKIETEKYITYITEHMDACSKEEKELLSQDRIDDANFAKIRKNIYEIAQTLFRNAERKEEDQAIYDQYLSLMDRIPSAWKVSLEKAKEHGRMDLCAVEEVKLAVADEVMKYFTKECVVK